MSIPEQAANHDLPAAGKPRRRRFDSGSRRHAALLWLMVGVVAVAMLGTIGTMLWAKRSSDLAAAEVTTRNLALVLEEQTAFSLAAVDASLSTFTTLWSQLPPARRPGRDALIRMLKQQTASGSYTRSIYILDTQGRMILHSEGTLAVDTFADREYFRTHVDADRGLHVSELMKGRITGRWGMVLSRRLADPDGRFAGVVVAALEPARLEQAFSGLDVGRRGRLSLRHVDGRLVVRIPLDEGAIGKMLPATPAMLARMGTSGVYTG